jgi:hypothetical protein
LHTREFAQHIVPMRMHDDGSFARFPFQFNRAPQHLQAAQQFRLHYEGVLPF